LRGLHHGALGEFIAARNALAKQLDKSGDKDAAAEVKSLPKPSVSAWAVNRLFEREPAKMEALLTAGEHARAGLRHAISGQGVEALRDALDAERAARDDLRRRAAGLIEEETGRKASPAILDRVSTNLDSLALSPESAELAARGWIGVDLAPPGFEVLSGMPLTGARRRPGHLRLVPPTREKREEPAKAAPAKSPEKKPEPGPTLKEQREQARAEAARRREEDVERQKREREEERRRDRLARLEEKVAEVRAEADAAKREADRADKIVEEAERALEEARRRLDNARDDARRSRQRADRAAERLARAEKDRG
jgi:hypothetical protein